MWLNCGISRNPWSVIFCMNMLFPKILGICEGAAFQEKEIKGEKQLCVRKKDKTSMPIVLKTM